MMTTLNGRIDDPDAWVTGVGSDQYEEIDRLYNTFDTILVGATTYAEMVGYWPDAAVAADSPPVVKRMGQRMNRYRKIVFTHNHGPLGWENSEDVRPQTDAELVALVQALKAEAGSDIHLSGGAKLVQQFVRLGLVDAYNLFVYPVVSAGATWFAQADSLPSMQLTRTAMYSDGVAGLFYVRE
jgi:dihydrofolate reductase